MNIAEVAVDALRSSILVSGLVVVMMMIIETFNVENNGRLLGRLRSSGFAQVLASALLGSLPGCVGGFAVVSLYTHRMLSFGALLAMMIATAGDEAFMMLALFPGKALLLTGILLVLAVAAGLVADRLHAHEMPTRLEDSFELHGEDMEHGRRESHEHAWWKRGVLLVGVSVFIAALLAGFLEEGEDVADQGFSLLNEEWMFWLFGAVSLIVLIALVFGSSHFVEEHLWDHIVCRHLPSIFAWTFGMLFAIGLLFSMVDLESWIGGNTFLMIILAIAIGLIPQSGPHLVFITLFAAGAIPFPVLLANSIVQDGHASMPLLADSRRSFILAKALKACLALVVSSACLLLS